MSIYNVLLPISTPALPRYIDARLYGCFVKVLNKECKDISRGTTKTVLTSNGIGGTRSKVLSANFRTALHLQNHEINLVS